MFSYSFVQWLGFFYIYSFVGWIIESVIVSVTERRLVNRGFLRGPFLPLYGFGGLVILFSTIPVKNNLFLVFLCGMVGTTLLEYFTAWLMELLFKMKYWDYSQQRFNYKGRISLTSSLFWGALSLFLIFGLHRLVEKVLFFFAPTALNITVFVLSAVVLADAIQAFRTALDVNKLLATITKITEEIEQLKEQLAEKVESSEYARNLKDRLQELRTELTQVLGKISIFKISLINAHPRAYSKNFNKALQAVRGKINERKSKWL